MTRLYCRWWQAGHSRILTPFFKIWAYQGTMGSSHYCQTRSKQTRSKGNIDRVDNPFLVNCWEKSHIHYPKYIEMVKVKILISNIYILSQVQKTLYSSPISDLGHNSITTFNANNLFHWKSYVKQVSKHLRSTGTNC